ncbi:universal stress protein [Streptomyces sp. NBC_01294]|uniref:universal stress protein n=1 Tax=Streptomyces sp. NBC_01294 TaxID=2903815 RepID=UPI002DD8FAFE|nr:universal stress protein [Streptomyces sp. NBC_01294]
MRRVVVGVTGTLGSPAALHRAAAEARARDAELRVVLAWQSPGGELGSRNGLSPSALAECRTAAVERLREILDTAFRAAKPGAALTGLTVRGTPGAALVDTARGMEDLLVVGTGSRTPLRRPCGPRWPATAWRAPPAPYSSCRPRPCRTSSTRRTDATATWFRQISSRGVRT